MKRRKSKKSGLKSLRGVQMKYWITKQSHTSVRQCLGLPHENLLSEIYHSQ
ncbi:MAG: hypothetical protein HOA57_02965 [Candidatus Magasanikbacteria bacterium]|nr:hypothetical protein [Candidatus Magasanikbacteria bacterium]MBT6819313.1 hypothetical protein [Candidatus Magasanikbacteria bacterium]